MVPKEITSASRFSAAYATAIDSLWTSRPTYRVLEYVMADLSVLPTNDHVIHHAALASSRNQRFRRRVSLARRKSCRLGRSGQRRRFWL